MRKTDCYFYFEHYDMGAHIPCCTFKEYPLGKCPCDECTNYLPKREVSKIVREYLKIKEEPKTGQWIEEDMFDGDVAYRCSECNELFWIESGTPKDNGYNFCPKCGKRLVEPQEGANE